MLLRRTIFLQLADDLDAAIGVHQRRRDATLPMEELTPLPGAEEERGLRQHFGRFDRVREHRHLGQI
jgi:hypothetical protein